MNVLFMSPKSVITTTGIGYTWVKQYQQLESPGSSPNQTVNMEPYFLVHLWNAKYPGGSLEISKVLPRKGRGAGPGGKRRRFQ